jgi:hypothetical protein
MMVRGYEERRSETPRRDITQTMGTYYCLLCQQCRQYVHCGKMLRMQSRMGLQGMYSETAQAWAQDTRVWEAIQTFLFDHRSHPLRFECDEDNRALDEYVEAELDVLLQKREGVKTESI